MPAAFVAERGTTALTTPASSTLTVTLSASTTAGNRLVGVVGGHEARTLSSVSDSRGNTWTVDRQLAVAGYVSMLAVASCHLTTALVVGDTVTFTFNAALGKARLAVLAEFSGVLSSGAVDRVASASGDSASLSSGATSATTQAAEVAVGAFLQTTIQTLTATGGYTQLSHLSADASDSKRVLRGAYKVLSATGAQTATASSTGSKEWLAAVVTYKAAPDTLTIAPSSIASAEAFGTATVTRGAQVITPASIESEEAFGTASVAAAGMILPLGIASEEAFGAAVVSVAAAPAIAPLGIESEEAFGTAVVTRAPQPRIVTATLDDEPVTTVVLSDEAPTLVSIEDSLT